MTKSPEGQSRSGKFRTLRSLAEEIEAYASAIADAESQGRGDLPQVQLLKQTLGEMKARLQTLKRPPFFISGKRISPVE